MNKVLWLLQILLALAFLAHGILLLFPPADMVAQMNESMSTSFRLFLGVAEVVAAIGLTLPGMTRIQPWWTQWADASPSRASWVPEPPSASRCARLELRLRHAHLTRYRGDLRVPVGLQGR